MSDARLSDYVNLKDALRSFSQESRAIMLDDEDVARLFGRALAQIESLQRTNEELRAGNDQFAEINSVYESAMATDRQRIKGLRAAAITPEMREAAEKWLEDYAPGNTVDYVAMALSGRVIIHALLKETVEPKGRALNWVSVDEEVPVHKAAVMLWYENGAFSRGWYDESIENFRDDAFTITDNLAVTHWAIPADPTLEGEQ